MLKLYDASKGEEQQLLTALSQYLVEKGTDG